MILILYDSFLFVLRKRGIWSTWGVSTQHSGSYCKGGGGYTGVIGLRQQIKNNKTFILFIFVLV